MSVDVADMIAQGGSVSQMVEIQTSLMVFGMLAAHFSDSPQSNARGWGAGERKNSICVGNDRWTCSRVSSEKELAAHVAFGTAVDGYRLTRTIDALNGGKKQKHFWFTAKGLRDAVLRIEGIAL